MSRADEFGLVGWSGLRTLRVVGGKTVRTVSYHPNMRSNVFSLRSGGRSARRPIGRNYIRVTLAHDGRLSAAHVKPTQMFVQSPAERVNFPGSNHSGSRVRLGCDHLACAGRQRRRVIAN